MNAGPLQEQWHEARRGLTSAQRRELWWANVHHRPVGRPDLAPAQLAFARYAVDSYRRTPMVRHRWIRIAVPALYLVGAAFQLIPALFSPHVHIVNLIAGGIFLVLAATWSYVVVRGLRKAERRLTDLQQQLHRQHGQTAA